jgi:hypothetical protein
MVGGRFPTAISRITERRRLSFHDGRRPSRERNQFNKSQERTTMTTVNKSIHRATIALNLPKKIPDLILYANNIAQKSTGNTAFADAHAHARRSANENLTTTGARGAGVRARGEGAGVVMLAALPCVG